MSLIKWSGGDEDRQALVKRVRELADRKEPVGKKEIVQTGLTRRASVPVPSLSAAKWTQGGDIARPDHAPIKLVRRCAVENALWLAHYEWHNDDFVFFNSAELPPYQQSRYSQENLIRLPPSFHTSPERCACCLTWTMDGATGSVLCDGYGGCGERVCYGRTSQSGFFKCCCGASGQLTPDHGDRYGLTPGRMRGNLGTQF